MTTFEIILVIILALNIITFITYGIDKLKAKKGWWRISEFTLLLLAFTGGSLGAHLAMKTFRHKTQHVKFKFGVPAMMFLHVALAAYILYHYQHHIL